MVKPTPAIMGQYILEHWERGLLTSHHSSHLHCQRQSVSHNPDRQDQATESTHSYRR